MAKMGRPRKDVSETSSVAVPENTKPMSKEEAMRIIESVARGTASKQQADAAKSWLDINGSGQKYARHILEVIHTYEAKPVSSIPAIPKIEMPKV